MQLNTDVWGAISEGHHSDWSEITAQGYQMTLGKYYNLYGYLQQNKVSFDAPIDNSIVYAGADKLGMGDVAYLYNTNDAGTDVDNSRMWTFYGEMPFAFAEIGNNDRHDAPFTSQVGGEDSKAYLINFGGTAISNNRRFLWLHGGGSDNHNDVVSPLIDFGLKAFFFAIVVWLKDANDSSKWVYMNEMSSYPNCRVLGAYLEGYYCYYKDSSNTYYQRLPNGSHEGYNYFAVMPLSPIKINNDEYMNYTDFVGMSGYLPLYGLTHTGSGGGYNSETGKYYCYTSLATKNKAMSGLAWNESYDGVPSFVGWNYCQNHANPDFVVNQWTGDYSDIYIRGFDLPNNDETKEYIMKAAASYGVFFTDGDPENLRNTNSRWTDSSMCLGLLENGVGKGRYTRGADNVNNPAYVWESYHENEYDPNKFNILNEGKKISRVYIGDQRVKKIFSGDIKI